MEKMKLLFFGAGVLGSLYAARLHEAGNEVTLVARGSRLEDIKKHGIVLEQFDNGERTATKVPVVDHVPPEEYFDLCVVLVQKNQLESALSALKVNPHIPTFLFMNNTAEGPQDMINAVGRERVMMGHANAGGERVGHVIHYMISQEMTLGELDGSKSERLKRIAHTFKEAGFAVEISKNVDAWKRYHVALAVPFAFAMYMNESCNYRLSENRKDVKLCMAGIREALKVLRTLGYPVEPSKLRFVFAFPDFLLVPLFQRVLKSQIADIGMARHLKNAREEMEQLSKEFLVLVEKAGIETPVLDELHNCSDMQVASEALSGA